MFGSFTTKCEKLYGSHLFQRKVKQPCSIKKKPRTMARDRFISSILTAETVIKMRRYSSCMSTYCDQSTGGTTYAAFRLF